MTQQTRQQLINLQKTLYEKAYKDAHALAVGTSKNLMSYSRKFEESLPNNASKINIKQIIQSIEKASIVLYGDFHTLKQSQRGLIRVLRAINEQLPRKTCTLALEAFRATDQKYINAYQRGTLNEETFLRKTHYHAQWGFPWANFKMIFDYAREHNIKIIGINSHNGGQDSLSQRDKFTAELLNTYLDKNPDEIILCLIGEHHLADDHLPKAIKNSNISKTIKTKIVRVLSNVDKYFFNIPPSSSTQEKSVKPTEYLHLKDNLFCVMNSPPWIKWQSFTIWEELRSIDENQIFDDDDAENEFDLYTEQTYDVDYHFLSITKNLIEFLGSKPCKNSLSKFSIFSDFCNEEYNKINFGQNSTDADAERMIERANLDGVYFVSDSHTVLLSDLSINNLSEASGQFVHRLLSNFTDTQGDQAEQFYRRIIKSAAGMIASKMLNPRRKCLSIEQFEKYLANNHRKRLTGHPKLKRDSFKEVIRFHHWMSSRVFDYGGKQSFMPKSIFQHDTQFNYEISRSLGLLIGYKLYTFVMSNRAPGNSLKRLFLQEVKSSADAWKLIEHIYRLVFCPSQAHSQIHPHKRA